MTKATTSNVLAHVHAFLLCDRTYMDRKTSKWVIAGTFSQVYCPGFPGQYAPPSELFIALSGLRGKVTLQIRFLQASSQLEVFRVDWNLKVSGPKVVIQENIQLPPLPLPDPGEYEFVLQQGQVRLASCPLEAIQLQDGQPPQRRPE